MESSSAERGSVASDEPERSLLRALREAREGASPRADAQSPAEKLVTWLSLRVTAGAEAAAAAPVRLPASVHEVLEGTEARTICIRVAKLVRSELSDLLLAQQRGGKAGSNAAVLPTGVPATRVSTPAKGGAPAATGPPEQRERRSTAEEWPELAAAGPRTRTPGANGGKRRKKRVTPQLLSVTPSTAGQNIGALPDSIISFPDAGPGGSAPPGLSGGGALAAASSVRSPPAAFQGGAGGGRGGPLPKRLQVKQEPTAQRAPLRPSTGEDSLHWEQRATDRDVLATLYGGLVAKRLLPRFLAELEVIFGLLSVPDSASHELSDRQHVMLNAQSARAFSLSVLLRCQHLVYLLPLDIKGSVLRQRKASEREDRFFVALASHVSATQKRRLEAGELSSSTTDAAQDFSLPFNEEKDSRNNCKDQESAKRFQAQERCRDAYLALLRDFESSKYQCFEAGAFAAFLDSVPLRVLSLVSPLEGDSIAWLADFTKDLLLKLAHSPIRETRDKVLKDKQFQQQPQKLRSLQQRMENSTHGARSGPTRARRQRGRHPMQANVSDRSTLDVVISKAATDLFPGYQEFFFWIIVKGDSHRLNRRLCSLISSELTDLRDRAEGAGAITYELVRRMKILGKFLGLLVFFPNWGCSHPEGAHGVQHMESLQFLPMLEGYIVRGQPHRMLVWLADFLKMAKHDGTARHNRYLQKVVSILRRLYAFTREAAIDTSTTTSHFLIMELLEDLFHQLGISHYETLLASQKPTSSPLVEANRDENFEIVYDAILGSCLPTLKNVASHVARFRSGEGKRMRPSFVNTKTPSKRDAPRSETGTPSRDGGIVIPSPGESLLSVGASQFEDAENQTPKRYLIQPAPRKLLAAIGINDQSTSRDDLADAFFARNDRLRSMAIFCGDRVSKRVAKEAMKRARAVLKGPEEGWRTESKELVGSSEVFERGKQALATVAPFVRLQVKQQLSKAMHLLSDEGDTGVVLDTAVGLACRESTQDTFFRVAQLISARLGEVVESLRIDRASSEARDGSDEATDETAARKPDRREAEGEAVGSRTARMEDGTEGTAHSPRAAQPGVGAKAPRASTGLGCTRDELLRVCSEGFLRAAIEATVTNVDAQEAQRALVETYRTVLREAERLGARDVRVALVDCVECIVEDGFRRREAQAVAEVLAKSLV